MVALVGVSANVLAATKYKGKLFADWQPSEELTLQLSNKDPRPRGAGIFIRLMPTIAPGELSMRAITGEPLHARI
nr:hypothetical protein [Rhodoferax sp.]